MKIKVTYEWKNETKEDILDNVKEIDFCGEVNHVVVVMNDGSLEPYNIRQLINIKMVTET